MKQNKIILKIFQDICIFSSAFLLFFIISNGNSNVFLRDDNISQWLPVINGTFGDLLKTGKLNYWNYYLMSGINLFDTGIYSLTNPIMFVSYLIYRLFNYSNTITIYIFLIFSFSLIIYNEVLLKLQIQWKKRTIILLCIASCTGYFTLGYWYYVFNNIFIGSLFFGFFYYIRKVLVIS